MLQIDHDLKKTYPVIPKCYNMSNNASEKVLDSRMVIETIFSHYL